MSEAQNDMAERLRQARMRAGHPSAIAAAKAMGISEPTYLGHENGSRGFRRNAPRYAKFFRVRVEWLLLGRGEPTGSQIEEIFSRLPPADQSQALEYLQFLESRSSKK